MVFLHMAVSGERGNTADKMRRIRIGKTKKITAVLLIVTVLMSSLCPVTALADGPDQFSALDDATYRKLLDDTAEWEEIENLVKYYNPTYRIYADSASGTSDTLSEAGDEFAEEMNESLDAIDRNLETIKTQRESLANLPGSMVIDGNGTTAAQALAQLNATEAMLQTGRTQAKQGLGQALTSITGTRIKTEESLESAREQIAKAVESLFISYAQLKINRELVVKQIGLYKTALQTQKTMREQDLATDADVTAAENSLKEAEISLQTVDNGMKQLQTAIGLQLGWSAEETPVIGDVPAPDFEYITAADKDADCEKALENNATYQAVGKLSNYSGSSAVSRRDAALNEAKGAALAKFESLYAEMQRQKLLYDAAQTSLKRAEIVRDQAERQMKLGLTGNAEYEGRQLEYLSYEASAKLAALNLEQAINDYRWAVRGYMEY